LGGADLTCVPSSVKASGEYESTQVSSEGIAEYERKKPAVTFSAPLQAILGRHVDLHSFIIDYSFDPAFQGSSSIKKVLLALVPDLPYKDLSGGDGETAIVRFAHGPEVR
jgi:hypothetical protein